MGHLLIGCRWPLYYTVACLETIAYRYTMISMVSKSTDFVIWMDYPLNDKSPLIFSGAVVGESPHREEGS
jgi:hypothetical protein